MLNECSSSLISRANRIPNRSGFTLVEGRCESRVGTPGAATQDRFIQKRIDPAGKGAGLRQLPRKSASMLRRFLLLLIFSSLTVGATPSQAVNGDTRS